MPGARSRPRSEDAGGRRRREGGIPHQPAGAGAEEERRQDPFSGARLVHITLLTAMFGLREKGFTSKFANDNIFNRFNDKA